MGHSRRRQHNRSRKTLKRRDEERLFEPRWLKGLLDRLDAVPPVLIVLSLFALSFGLRLAYKNAGLFLFDSVILAQATERTFESGTLHGQVNGRHGSVVISLLFYVPYRLVTGTESAEQSVLFANIFFGSLGVIAVYALTRVLLEDGIAALIASLLLSVSPIYLSTTTYAKPQGTEVFLVTSSMLCVALFKKRRAWWWLVFGSSLLGVAILSREASLIFLPLFLLLYLDPQITLKPPRVSLNRERLALRSLSAGFGPLTIALVVGYFAFLDKVIFHTLFTEGTSTVTFLGIWSPSLSVALKDLHLDLTTMGVALSLMGVVVLCRSSANFLPVLFLLLWAGLLFYIGNTIAYWARMLGIISIPFFIFIAVAIARIYRWFRFLGAALALGLALVLFLDIRPIIASRSHTSGEKQHALWIKDIVPPGSVIVVQDDAVFIRYYAGLKHRKYPIGAAQTPVRLLMWVKETRELIESGTPVFLTSGSLAYDRTGAFRRALMRNFQLERVGALETEDYHHSAIKFRHHKAQLFRILPRPVDSRR